MNVNKTKIVVDPRVRLPFDYIRGSEAKRYALAEKLTDDLFQKVKVLYRTSAIDSDKAKSTAVPKEIIEQKIQEVIPKPLNIKVKQLLEKHKHTPNTVGTTYYDEVYKKGKIIVKEVGILMPLTKDGKVNYKQVGTLLHEFRHVMDGLINPKTDMRSMKICYGGHQITGLFHEYINTFDKKFNFLNKMIFNIKLNWQMRNFSDEMKIDELQEMRNVIKTEINAYSNELKYQEVISKNLGAEYTLKTDEERLAEFDFDRKFAFINKKLYKTIKKARQKHAKELGKSAGIN